LVFYALNFVVYQRHKTFAAQPSAENQNDDIVGNDTSIDRVAVLVNNRSLVKASEVGRNALRGARA
jgi:hypothetical protein